MSLYTSGSMVLLLLFTLSVMLVRTFPAAEEYGGARGSVGARTRRGFREGSADRIAHGFGKRSQKIEEILRASDVDTPEYVVRDEKLADALTRSRRLSEQFVRAYVDLNDDGVITDDELLI